MRSDWHCVGSMSHDGHSFESLMYRPKGLQWLDVIGSLSLRAGDVMRLLVRRAGMGDMRADLPERWVDLVDIISISFPS